MLIKVTDKLRFKIDFWVKNVLKFGCENFRGD